MSIQDQIQKDFLLPDLKKDGVKLYLQKISKVVSDHRGSKIQLKKMEEYRFKVGTLKETSYFYYKPHIFEEWENNYLPETMSMEVIGGVEKFTCRDFDELVLMVCEDGKVFAAERNRLNLVSNNLEDLFKNGLQFPGTKQ